MSDTCVIVADRRAEARDLERYRPPADLVLAPTGEGALALGQGGLAAVTPVGLVGYPRLRELSVDALDVRDRFLSVVCQGQTLDGIDWPGVFKGDQELFYFRELLLAREVLGKLIERGISRVRWIHGRGEPGDRPSEAFLEGLRHFADSDLDLSEERPRSLLRSWRRWQDRTGRGLRRLGDRLREGPTPASCVAVAVFSSQQWRRFGETLEELHKFYGKGFQFWYLGRSDGSLRSWCRERGISLFDVAYPRTVDADVARFFAGCEASPAAENPEARRAVGILRGSSWPPRLRLFLRYTLPRTAQWGRALTHDLRIATPEVVIGSAAFTYMVALPFHVARVLGIPSVALAHTAVSGDHSPVAAGFLACGDRFQRRNFARAFSDDGRILACRGVAAEPTAAGSSGPAVSNRKRPVVAMLSASPNLGSLAMPLVDTDEYNATLRSLLRPPADLSELEFIFKWHPRFDLYPIAGRLPRSENVHLLPGVTPVGELIEAAWVSVVFNHYGSVATDVVRRGNPVIFLDSASYHFPRVSTLAFAAGEVVDSPDAFWDLLRRLRASAPLYEALARRCRSFASSELAPATDSLVQRLQRLERQDLGVA